MIYTTGTSGKIEGLRMMTKVETGSHLGMSMVHCRKVSAVILEPVSTGVLLHSQHCMRCDVSCHVASRHLCALLLLFRVGIDSNFTASLCLLHGPQLVLC